MSTEIGHNNPPEVLKLAPEVIADISGKMADIPVVESEDDARLIKMEIDRGVACMRDLEAERDGKVRPLNAVVDNINLAYHRPKRLLGDLLDEMRARLKLFMDAETLRREQAAAEARVKAKLAEDHAREMERIEREKLDNASKGEVGVNAAEVIAEADDAYDAYCAAERAAKLAEKETHVKIGGGFSRAIGMRKTEVLTIVDGMAALKEMGWTPGLVEELLKSAKAWRKVHGKLPNGITSKVEEHL